MVIYFAAIRARAAARRTGEAMPRTAADCLPGDGFGEPFRNGPDTNF